VLSEKTTNRPGWATKLNYLLKLAPQIRNLINRRSPLGFLNFCLLAGLQCLLAHDSHLVVSTAVVVPDFATGGRISDSKIEGFLFCTGENICQLD